MSDFPEFIGRFRVLRSLGEGGMGALYLAEDPRLERRVAIKLLKEDSAELRERFQREARTAARLRHVNIVSIFEVDEFDGQPFIAMEYIPGETLGEMVRRRAPIAVGRKLEMMEDLCSGLAHAHKEEIIHRDVKPANVMIDPEGLLKVLDFGIARLNTSTMTQSGMLVGTLNYMSPEQISGEPIDKRSDIFAVGAVFYELLTYRQAFPGRLPEVLARIIHRAPESLEALVPGIDPEIVRIVDRALEKSVADRYQDLRTMRRDLAAVRRRIESEEASGATVVIDREVTQVVQRPGGRTSEISVLLTNARAALDAGDLEAAQVLVASVQALDPGNSSAVAFGEAIRAQTLERQTSERLAEAEREMTAGALTRASEIVRQLLGEAPNSPDARRLASEIDRRLEDRARKQRREAAIDEGLTRARAQYDEGAFDLALRTLDDVFALDAGQSTALALAEALRSAIAVRARRELDEQAAQAISQARELFAAGDRAGAIAHLSEFTPSHPGVSSALGQLIAESAEIDREASRRERIAELLDGGRSALMQGDLDAAAAALTDLDAIDPDNAAAPELGSGIDAARDARARATRLEGLMIRAADAIDVGALDDAGAVIDEVERLGGSAIDLEQIRTRLQAARELRRRQEAFDAHMAAGERALDAGRPDAAQTAVTAALALFPQDERAERFAGRVAAAVEARAAEEREELQRKEAAERLAREQRQRDERQRQEAAERLATEQRQRDERQRQEAAERLAAEQRQHDERQRHEAAERLAAEQRQRDERQRQEAAERLAAEQRQRDERQRQEAAERLAAEQRQRDERQRQEAAERLVAEQRQRDERQRQEAAERLAAEQRRRDERQRREAADRLEQEEQLQRDRALAAAVTEVRNLSGPAAEAVVASGPEAATVRRSTVDTPLPIRDAPRQRSAWLYAAAGIVVLIVAGGLFLQNKAKPIPTSSEPAQAGKTVPDAGSSKPAGVAATPPREAPKPSAPLLLPVAIDAVPWARVRIRPVSTTANIDVGEQITPFVTSLPSGEYSLELSNDQTTRPFVKTVRVLEGQANRISIEMPGYDPDKVLTAILGKR